MNIAETLNAIAGISTALGVCIAAYQIRVGRISGVQQFEDGFAKEYREVAGRLPPEALLGLKLNEEEMRSCLMSFIAISTYVMSRYSSGRQEESGRRLGYFGGTACVRIYRNPHFRRRG